MSRQRLFSSSDVHRSLLALLSVVVTVQGGMAAELLCLHFAPTGGGGKCASMLAWKVVEGTWVLLPPPRKRPGAGAGAPLGCPKDAETAATRRVIA